MKRIKLFACAIVLAATSAITLSAFTSASDAEATHAEETHTHATGKHCSGSVGCSCSGFSPITNGEVWQQSYCRHCGHKKSCHK